MTVLFRSRFARIGPVIFPVKQESVEVKRSYHPIPVVVVVVSQNSRVMDCVKFVYRDKGS